MKPLVESALSSLRGPRFRLPDALAKADELNLNRPGLYAVFGDERAWQALGLGAPPDDRPVYVGKAQDNVAARDLRQHFSSGQTGRSTLRRTVAALLRDHLDLTPRPRGTHPLDSTARANLFALELDGESRLTEWMTGNLQLTFWAIPSIDPSELARVEDDVIRELEPPLCLNKWSDARWRPQIKRARAEMADMVRSGALELGASADLPSPAPRPRGVGRRTEPDEISAFLQKRLSVMERAFTTAVEAAQWLDAAGLLKDSTHRRGAPLRKLLRAGLIKGQRQEPDTHWYIDLVRHEGSDS